NIEGLNILQLAAFGMYLDRELNSDIDGKAKDTIPAILIEHPLRKHLFGDLSELQIHYYCSQLDQTFERQEYCAQCESWSYFDEEEGAAEFALGNAAWLMDMVQHVPINSPSDGEQGHIQLPTRPAHYDNWALPKLIETVIRQRFESLQRFLP